MNQLVKFEETLSSPSMKATIENTLKERSNTFMASVLSVVKNNDKLMACDPNSVINACLTATALDLPVNSNLGFAYIIPYGDSAQMQLGYKAYLQLAIRSGQFVDIIAKEVYEGQVVSDSSFRGFSLNWSGKISDKVVGFASYFRLKDGFEDTLYMSKEEIEKHAKEYSQTYKKYGTGLWKDQFNKMGIKTVLKLHLNSGKAPLSVDMQKAVNSDQAVIKDYESNSVDYIDRPNRDQIIEAKIVDRESDLIELWNENKEKISTHILNLTDEVKKEKGTAFIENMERVIEKKETSNYEKSINQIKAVLKDVE